MVWIIYKFARESSNTVEEKAAYSKAVTGDWQLVTRKRSRGQVIKRGFPKTSESKAWNRYLSDFPKKS